MQARTQNACQLVLTNPISSQRGHNVYLNMCRQNPSYANEATKCISTCINQTPPCLWGHKMYHNSCLPNRSQAREDTKCISKCVKQIHLMPAETQKISQRVLAKPLPCQLGHKINLNIYWPYFSLYQLVLPKPILHHREHKMYLYLDWLKPTHKSQDRKFISTCVDQTPPMLTKTQNASQRVLCKPISCLRGHNMQLNICWPNSVYVSDVTKCISTRVEQTYPSQARTQSACQMWGPNPSLDSENTKCITTYVDETLSIPATTKNQSQHV